MYTIATDFWQRKVGHHMVPFRPSPQLLQRVLVLALILCIVPAYSQEERPALAVLKAAGEFLLDAVKDYGVHESLDRMVAFATHRKELDEVERELRNSLSEAQEGTGTELAQLRAELNVTQSQLHALHQLQQSGLTQSDLNNLYQEIRQAQATVNDVLEDHERRIADLQKQVKSLDSKVASLEARFSAQNGAAESHVPLPHFSPSRKGINCSKPYLTGAERLICDNRVLLGVDGEMGQIYYTLHDDLLYSVNKLAAHELSQEQLRWINWRNNQLVTVCARGDEVDLSCAVPLWQSRIKQLTAALFEAKSATLR